MRYYKMKKFISSMTKNKVMIVFCAISDIK